MSTAPRAQAATLTSITLKLTLDAASVCRSGDPVPEEDGAPTPVVKNPDDDDVPVPCAARLAGPR
jgi:hypothetical protein